MEEVTDQKWEEQLITSAGNSVVENQNSVSFGSRGQYPLEISCCSKGVGKITVRAL